MTSENENPEPKGNMALYHKLRNRPGRAARAPRPPFRRDYEWVVTRPIRTGAGDLYPGADLPEGAVQPWRIRLLHRRRQIAPKGTAYAEMLLARAKRHRMRMHEPEDEKPKQAKKASSKKTSSKKASSKKAASKKASSKKTSSKKASKSKAPSKPAQPDKE